MAASLWRLCAYTIFQKTNLLVVSQKLFFFLIICHKAICSCEFRALLCWYVQEFSSRVNRGMEWSNWLPVCHVRFYQICCLISRRLLQEALNICSTKTTLALSRSRYEAANLLSSTQTKQFSSANVILGKSLPDNSKDPEKLGTGHRVAPGTAWIKLGLINKCRVSVFKGLWLRLLAAHTVIKANLRSCQRLCSHCLIETIPYLFSSNKAIREQAEPASFCTSPAPREPRAHTASSLRERTGCSCCTEMKREGIKKQNHRSQKD